MTTPEQPTSSFPQPLPPKKSSFWGSTVGILLTVVVAFLAGAGTTYLVLGNKDKDAAPVAAANATTQPQPEPEPDNTTTATADKAMKLGQLFTYDNGGMTTTVLRYKQPAGSGPDLAKGEVLGGVEVRTCVLAGADSPQQVSVGPWSLEWTDGTTVDSKWSGVLSEEYPYDAKTVKPGRCVKGWIVFTVPAKAKPALAVYEGDGNRGRPAEWRLS